MAQLTLIIGNKNYSSWSLRPWLAMKQAGLEFREIRIPLDTPETHEQILRYSPSGKVPALQDGELIIWESFAICEYITENFAPQLLPQDKIARALARAVSCEMHAGFFTLREKMPMDCRARRPKKVVEPKLRADIDRVTSIWRNFRQQFSSQGDFLLGQFSLADAMFAPVVSRFVTYGVALDAVEKAYAGAIWELPAMQSWLAASEEEKEILLLEDE